MITYVNTVLVTNQNGTSLADESVLNGADSLDTITAAVGKLAIMSCDPDAASLYLTSIEDAEAFKVGVVNSGHTVKYINGKKKYFPVVKWSNIIKKSDIRTFTHLTYQDDEEDTIKITFADDEIKAGRHIVIRLTFKDTPTRYRNWSESYDYLVKDGDTAADVVAKFAETITNQSRRARVEAEVDGATLKLTAMLYDDDNSNDTFNDYAKVRFNANVWYTDSTLPAFASNNKYAIGTIEKTNGVTYPASAKLVRDRERDAQGYQGLMHRCKWYDPKPAMVTNIDYKYGGIIIEFENMYRTADDLFRKTKQTLEIYASNNGTAVAPAEIAGGAFEAIGTALDNSKYGLNA